MVIKLFDFNNQLGDIEKVSKEMVSSNKTYISNLKKTLLYNYSLKLESKNTEVKSVLNEDKVVLYFSEGNCGSCVQEMLNYMEQLSLVIGKRRLLLMGNFKEKKNFEKYVKGLSFIGESVYCMDAGFSEEINEHPIVFIANSNLEVRSVFVPDFCSELKEEYFTKIVPNYFKN